VVVVLAATFVCPSAARGARGRRPPLWFVPLMAFLVIGLASAAWVGGLQALAGLKLDFFYLLLGWAVWRCPLNLRERDSLVSILMTTGLITALVGIGQQAIGWHAVHDLGYDYNTTIRFIGNSLRAFSTFENAPAFAMYVMVVLLIGIPQALEDRHRLRNQIFLWLLPVYVIGLGSAFSRSALLGLGVGLLFLGFRRYRIVLAAVPLILVAFLVFGGNITETLSSSSSLTDRTTGWEENVRQVSAHPLGAGIGSVGSAAETVIKLTGLSANRYQPDNYYFKTVYEVGVLGLWMFILFLFYGLVSVHRVGSRARGPSRALADGIAAQIVAAIAAAFTASYLEIFPMDVLFWLLLVVAATIDTESNDRASAEGKQTPALVR
jgi:hypothetical protein